MTRRALAVAATLLAFLLVAAPAQAAWVWPVRGEVITPYRNGDDPYAAGQHRGIDIAAEVGTPVLAATDGEVRFAGTAGSSGLTVSIRTEDGAYDTSYLHLSERAVRAGQRVRTGERIGSIGVTGERSAERPHLHFGVREAGTRHAYRDPLELLPPPGLAPERPREAPGPDFAPVPLAPDSAPAPAPVRPPRGVPAPRGAPSPGGAPSPRVAPGPRVAPYRRPRPSPRAAPGPAAALGAAPGPHPAGRPHAGRGPAPAGLPAGLDPHAAAVAPTATGPPESAPDRGPDVGWALACLGLLAAAAVLGLSEDGRGITRRGRRRLAALLSLRPGAP